MVKLRELIVILDLHRQGLRISAIAERTGLDRKTVRKYIECGLEAPVYGPREPHPRIIEPYEGYVQERLSAYPELSTARLLRKIRELGYPGGKTMLGDFVREVCRPQLRCSRRVLRPQNVDRCERAPTVQVARYIRAISTPADTLYAAREFRSLRFIYPTGIKETHSKNPSFKPNPSFMDAHTNFHIMREFPEAIVYRFDP